MKRRHTDKDIAGFHAEADKCRRLSERAADPLEKWGWLLVAVGWIELVLASQSAGE